MKQLFVFVIFFFIITVECNAACISGNCTNGHGTFIKNNGNKYVGQFKNGLQNGEGTFIFTNGNKYIGQWKDGKRHGHGIFTTSNGSKYDGQWENNYRKGAGTFTKVNGDTYPCIDGQRILTPEEKAINAKVIAIVLGTEITYKDRGNLDGEISDRIFKQFAKDNKIEPTAKEINLCSKKMKANMKRDSKETKTRFKNKRDKLIRKLKNESLSSGERQNISSKLEDTEIIIRMIRKDEKEFYANVEKIAQRLVAEWKLNKALYAKYGGRIIFQQGGAEPIDAYRDLLKEQAKKGSFEIFDKKYEPKFWNYFSNDNIHSFMDDGEKLINTPWWMMDE